MTGMKKRTLQKKNQLNRTVRKMKKTCLQQKKAILQRQIRWKRVHQQNRMWQRKARRKSPPLWRKAYPRKRLRQRLRQQFRRQRVLLNLRLQLQNQRQTRKWSW